MHLCQTHPPNLLAFIGLIGSNLIRMCFDILPSNDYAYPFILSYLSSSFERGVFLSTVGALPSE